MCCLFLAPQVDVIHAGDCLAPELTLLDVVYMYKWNEDAPLKFLYTVLAPPSIPTRKRVKNSFAFRPRPFEASRAKSKSLSPKAVRIPPTVATDAEVKQTPEKTVPSITLKIEKTRDFGDTCLSNGVKAVKRKSDDLLSSDTGNVCIASIVNNGLSKSSVTTEPPPKKKTKSDTKIHDSVSNHKLSVNDVIKQQKCAETGTGTSELERSSATVFIKKECLDLSDNNKASESALPEDMDCDNVNNQTMDSLDSSRDDGEGRMVIDESPQSDDEQSPTSPTEMPGSSNAAALTVKATSNTNTNALTATTNAPTSDANVSASNANVTASNASSLKSNASAEKLKTQISVSSIDKIPTESIVDNNNKENKLSSRCVTSTCMTTTTSEIAKKQSVVATNVTSKNSVNGSIVAGPSVPMVRIPRPLPPTTNGGHKKLPSTKSPTDRKPNSSLTEPKKLSQVINNLSSKIHNKSPESNQTSLKQGVARDVESPEEIASSPSSASDKKLTVPPLRISKSPQMSAVSKAINTNANSVKTKLTKLSLSSPSKTVNSRPLNGTNTIANKLNNIINNCTSKVSSRPVPIAALPIEATPSVSQNTALSNFTSSVHSTLPTLSLQSQVQQQQPYSLSTPNSITSFAARSPNMTITTVAPILSANPVTMSSPLTDVTSSVAYAAVLADVQKRQQLIQMQQQKQKVLHQIQQQEERVLRQKLLLQSTAAAATAQAKSQQVLAQTISSSSPQMQSISSTRSPIVSTPNNSSSPGTVRSPYPVGFPFNQRPPFIAPTKPRLGRPPNPNKAQNVRGSRGGRGGRGRRGGGVGAAPPPPRANLPPSVAGLQQALQQQALQQQQQQQALQLQQQQQQQALQQQQQQRAHATSAQFPPTVQQQLAMQSPLANLAAVSSLPNAQVLNNNSSPAMELASYMADVQAVHNLFTLGHSLMHPNNQNAPTPPMDLSPNAKCNSPLIPLRGGGGLIPPSPNPHASMSPQYTTMSSPNPYAAATSALLGSVVSSPTTAQFNRSSSISPSEAGASPAATPRSASAPHSAPSPRPARSPAPASPSAPNNTSICSQTPEVTITKLPPVSSVSATSKVSTTNTISITKRQHGISITTASNNDTKTTNKSSNSSNRQITNNSSNLTKSKSNNNTVSVMTKSSSKLALPAKHNNINNNSPTKLQIVNNNNNGSSSNSNGRSPSSSVKKRSNNNNSPLKDADPLPVTSAILKIESLTKALPAAPMAAMTALPASGASKY